MSLSQQRVADRHETHIPRESSTKPQKNPIFVKQKGSKHSGTHGKAGIEGYLDAVLCFRGTQACGLLLQGRRQYQDLNVLPLPFPLQEGPIVIGKDCPKPASGRRQGTMGRLLPTSGILMAWKPAHTGCLRSPWRRFPHHDTQQGAHGHHRRRLYHTVQKRTCL